MKMRLTFISLAIAFLAINCASLRGRVIEQTETTAVIEGRGPTEYEAKKNAQAKATDLFQSFKETKDAECSQGYRSSGSTSGTGNHRKYSSSGKSYFSCVIFVEKT